MANNVKIAILLTAMDKASKVIEGSIAKSQAKLKSFQKGLSKVGTVSAVAGAAGIGFFSKAVSDAQESEVASARLRQVFKSMGQDYVKATKQSEDYASQLQSQIAVEDESIMAVQAKLATFKSASNAAARASGMYNEATLAAFDLQAAGFGEAEQNIVQIGKALQDPIKGITSLAKSGVTFTNQEKEKIKVLVKSGKLMEAQKIIMGSIKSQVGGVAAATASPFKKMKIAIGEVSEQVGKILLPYVVKLAAKVTEFVPKIQAWIENNQQLIKWTAAAAIGLTAFGVVTNALNPIISAVTAMYGFSGKALKLFSFQVTTANKLLMTTGIILVITAIALAAYLIIKNWKSIGAWFGRLWKGVKNVFSAALKGIKFYFLNFTPVGLIYKHWGTITKFFSNLWTAVKNIFIGAVTFVFNLHQRFFEAGRNIITSLWNGMKAVVMKPVNLVRDMATKIRKFLPFSPAKEGALRDIHKIKLVETIAATIKPQPLIAAMDNTMRQFAGHRPAVQPVASRSGGGFSLTSNITVNGNGDRDEINRILDIRDRDLLKKVESAQSRRNALSFK